LLKKAGIVQLLFAEDHLHHLPTVMIMRHIVILALLFFGGSTPAWAVECKDLNTTAKVQKFLGKAMQSNPLLRAKVSAKVEVSPCEGKTCKSKKLRKSFAETLHLVRSGKNARLYFVKGDHAPGCLVRRGQRRFLCSSCRSGSNESCRSFTSSDSTTWPGTNIDTSDFSLLQNDISSAKCQPLKNKKQFLMIESLRSAKPYDRILSYYDKKKEVPITVNFFNKGVLRKVYRFFPKYYVKVKGQWFSTVMRVRTTKGREKAYLFETLLHIPRSKGRPQLYLNPKKDPALRVVSLDSLFATN